MSTTTYDKWTDSVGANVIGFTYELYSTDGANSAIIHQKDTKGDSDFVVLSPSDARRLAAALLKFADEREGPVCEHGVKEGDWCEPCNRAYKEAAKESDND